MKSLTKEKAKMCSLRKILLNFLDNTAPLCRNAYITVSLSTLFLLLFLQRPMCSYVLCAVSSLALSYKLLYLLTNDKIIFVLDRHTDRKKDR